MTHLLREQAFLSPTTTAAGFLTGLVLYFFIRTVLDK